MLGGNWASCSVSHPFVESVTPVYTYIYIYIFAVWASTTEFQFFPVLLQVAFPFEFPWSGITFCITFAELSVFLLYVVFLIFP